MSRTFRPNRLKEWWCAGWFDFYDEWRGKDYAIAEGRRILGDLTENRAVNGIIKKVTKTRHRQAERKAIKDILMGCDPDNTILTAYKKCEDKYRYD